MSQAFEQKNIVVTGATGGIGFEIVKRLKSQGANVFLVSHDYIALGSSLSELGLSHEKGVAVDFLQPESINQVITTANQVFDNHIDTLVNCAGMLSFAPFEQTDPD
jgi:3-oxoacyl-[acyl-carrier protein] reductase